MSDMFQPRADGASRRQARTQQEEKARRKTRIIMVSVITVLVLFFTAALFINSKFIRRNYTALTIGGVNFTIVDFEYFFNTEYVDFMNWMSQMQGMGGSMPESGRPLSSQIFDEETGATWADYFTESAFRKMSMIVQIYNAATAAGYKLSDEETARINDELVTIRLQAAEYGYPSTDSLLQQMFGNSIDEKSYRKLLEFTMIAESYSNHVRESFNYSTVDLESYYFENRDTLDIFSYRSLMIYAERLDPLDFPNTEDYLAAIEDSIAEVSLIAAEIAAGIESEDDFISAAMDYEAEFYSDPDSTLRVQSGERLDEQLSSWMLDATRMPGDIELIDSDQGCNIIFFVSRDDNGYLTSSMRQILILRERINPAEFELGEDDPEYIEAVELAENEARERAELVFALFTASGGTESALNDLIKEYSDEYDENFSGDISEIGYYKDIAKYPYQSSYVYAMQVVPEIEEWLFDPEREIGDYELIRSEAHGYHLMYFPGYGDRMSDIISEDKMRTRDHNAWNDGLAEVEPVKHWAFILVQI